MVKSMEMTENLLEEGGNGSTSNSSSSSSSSSKMGTLRIWYHTATAIASPITAGVAFVILCLALNRALNTEYVRVFTTPCLPQFQASASASDLHCNTTFTSTIGSFGGPLSWVPPLKRLIDGESNATANVLASNITCQPTLSVFVRSAWLLDQGLHEEMSGAAQCTSSNENAAGAATCGCGVQVQDSTVPVLQKLDVVGQLKAYTQEVTLKQVQPEHNDVILFWDTTNHTLFDIVSEEAGTFSVAFPFVCIMFYVAAAAHVLYDAFIHWSSLGTIWAGKSQPSKSGWKARLYTAVVFLVGVGLEAGVMAVSLPQFDTSALSMSPSAHGATISDVIEIASFLAMVGMFMLVTTVAMAVAEGCCKGKKGKNGKRKKSEWVAATELMLNLICCLLMLVSAAIGLCFKFTSHLHTMVALMVAHHVFTAIDMILGSNRTLWLQEWLVEH